MADLEKVLKNVMYAGVGAVQTVIDKSGEVADKLIERGQKTVADNAGSYEQLKQKAKDAVKSLGSIDVHALSDEQRADLRRRLDAYDAERAEGAQAAADDILKDAKSAAENVAADAKATAETIVDGAKDVFSGAKDVFSGAKDIFGDVLKAAGEAAGQAAAALKQTAEELSAAMSGKDEPGDDGADKPEAPGGDGQANG